MFCLKELVEFKLLNIEYLYIMSIMHVSFILITFILKFCAVQNAVISKNEDSQNSHNGICLTADCIMQAAFLLHNMDQEVDPCDDFYKYTCGNFIKKTLVPQNRLSVSSFTSIHDSLLNDLLSGVETDIKSNDLDAFKKMKIYYQNCLHESRKEEEEDLGPHLNILEKLGGWPILMGNSWSEETYTWQDTVFKIQSLGFRAGFPFQLTIYADKKNETKNIFHLYPAITIIHNETQLYLESNKTLDAYYNYISDIAVMLGANETIIYQEVKDLIKFEIDLLKIEPPFQEREKNSSSVEQQKTILELDKQFPNIQWLELLNNILSLSNETIDGTDVIEIFDMNYVSKLETLLSQTPKRILANYQIWIVLNSAINFMPKKFWKRKAIFRNIALDMLSIKMSIEMACFYAVGESFHVAINGLYIRKYFDHEIKVKVTQMAIDIKNQFTENFQKSWMSHENTTEEILKKLNSMNMSIGYPEELINDEKLEEYYANLQINPGLYINSALNVSLFKMRKLYKSLRKPVDKNSWIQHAHVTIVNAFYSRRNVATIPAGILHEPFIYMRGPEYLNYGAIGSVIAHEITHGIYRGDHKKKLNYTASAIHNATVIPKNFDQCFIDKYNNYNIAKDIAANGSLTLHENIADITGFKIAYQVYNEWTKRNNITELNLPGLDHTPRQMFWISAASTYCRKQKIKYLKEQMKYDVHSPAEARINVAFSNIDDFAQDFKCKEGLKMNPLKKCDLW